VKLAEKYDEIARAARSSGCQGGRRPTGRLRHAQGARRPFPTIAEEEKRSAGDPAGAASAILRKVFGAAPNLEIHRVRRMREMS